MKLRPADGYVIIRPIEADRTTQSGIILPEGSKEPPAKGTVIVSSVDGISKDEMIFYKKWMDQEIEVDGEKLKAVKGEDIVAIYE